MRRRAPSPGSSVLAFGNAGARPRPFPIGTAEAQVFQALRGQCDQATMWRSQTLSLSNIPPKNSKLQGGVLLKLSSLNLGPTGPNPGGL